MLNSCLKKEKKEEKIMRFFFRSFYDHFVYKIHFVYATQLYYLRVSGSTKSNIKDNVIVIFCETWFHCIVYPFLKI